MKNSTTPSSFIDLNLLKKQQQIYNNLLDRDLFYEAHEALEEIWFPLRFEQDDEVRLIRAYINAAVSFELVKRGREKSGLKPWGFFNRHKGLITKASDLHKSQYTLIYEAIMKTQKRLNCFNEASKA